MVARVGILGGGLIGAGWAALFAHVGYEVIVVDPDPDTKRRLDDAAQNAKAPLEALVPRRHGGSIRHDVDLASLGQVGFVQECLPEKLNLKQAVLSALEPHIKPGVVIASSSSGLSPDDIASGLKHPDRLLIGHPCNPPYLLQLVEIVPGAKTSKTTIDRTRGFYEAAGRTVIIATKSAPGHIVNRLQAALWREMLHLWRSGVCDLNDLNLAVTQGLAPRWCLIDPTDIFLLSGGARGMVGFIDALSPEMDRWWSDLGDVTFDEPLAKALIAATADTDRDQLIHKRDLGLPILLEGCKRAAELQTDEMRR